ncbi:Thioredoxin-like protein 1 [Savitreella phatthalungensis]
MVAVIEVASLSHFNELRTSKQVLILDAYATWCGPCKAIKPKFQAMAAATTNEQVSFAQVDVDQQRPVAQALNISAMPTFTFFVAGKQVEQIKGADPHRLESAVKKYVAQASASVEQLPRGMVSLNDRIDIKQLEILNAADPSTLRSMISKDGPGVISDADEQLMLFVPFQELVKIHSITIRVESEHLSNAPTKLRFYLNRPAIISFDEVDSLPAIQEIHSIEYDDGGKATVQLRYVKFQRVNSLIVFVEGNAGEEDETRIRSMEFIGEIGMANATGTISKVDEES